MALPTSGPLSMSAIATEFSQASSNMSLYTFGSTLPTPTVEVNIKLANAFYGQSASSCASFASSESPARGGAEEACELAAGATYYHNGSGSYPEPEDVVFGNSSCSIFLSSGAYKMGSGNVMIIGESGQVEEISGC
tara:strand:- start:642 stop:1049 length:408 start_codon:yes stop_codon:yes gene_type:complete